MDVFVYSPWSRDTPLCSVPRHASWFARNHKQAQIKSPPCQRRGHIGGDYIVSLDTCTPPLLAPVTPGPRHTWNHGDLICACVRTSSRDAAHYQVVCHVTRGCTRIHSKLCLISSNCNETYRQGSVYSALRACKIVALYL